MLKLLLSLLFLLVPAGILSVGKSDTLALKEWRAGSVVSFEAVKAYGVSRCFRAEPLPDRVFSRMQGRSFDRGCTVSRSSLRYVRVLHYDASGRIKVGELVCNQAISADLVSIFRALYDARYPIERMVLIDDYGADDERSMAANNTSCFNFRTVSGTRTLSNHSRGMAVDVNPLYNPYVKRRGGKLISVQPAASRRYADRSLSFPMRIDRNDLCYRLFIKHGFTWGGDWRSSKDYQHFEKR